MESKHYEITVGEVQPVLTAATTPEPLIAQPCQHVTARGHHCHMLSIGDSGLCPHHARQQFGPSPDPDGTASISEDTADELLGVIKDFRSPAAVNLFLGNLVKQVVRKRVTRRDAVTLAYLSQLILNSQSAMTREQAVAPKPRPNIVWDGIFAPDFGKRPPINETPIKGPQTKGPQIEG